ncbi:MAG TPA: hypothetical protein VE398_00555, partial [Acidobacteriota bacterium]|nr:hypothetical protein [Acidobacteriota bacterium]
MKQFNCDREPIAIEAARSGTWDEGLRGHVSNCRNCADAVAAYSFLRQLELPDCRCPELPAAGQMWWKMQVRARREAIERAARPISLLQTTMLVLAAISFAGVCLWQRGSFGKGLDSLVAGWHLNPAPLQEFVMNVWSSWSYFLIAGAGAVAILVTLAV